MKKLSLVLSFMMLSGIAYANPPQTGPQGPAGPQGIQGKAGINGEDATAVNEYGAKLDAPKLVHIKGNWYAGAEGGKNLYNTSQNNGWFAYGKVTYYGTVLDFDKKGE